MKALSLAFSEDLQSLLQRSSSCSAPSATGYYRVQGWFLMQLWTAALCNFMCSCVCLLSSTRCKWDLLALHDSVKLGHPPTNCWPLSNSRCGIAVLRVSLTSAWLQGSTSRSLSRSPPANLRLLFGHALRVDFGPPRMVSTLLEGSKQANMHMSVIGKGGGGAYRSHHDSHHDMFFTPSSICIQGNSCSATVRNMPWTVSVGSTS